ncbi:hypothetical protein GCM10023083_31560 [Streptomyces phyllanthi]
MSTDDTTMVTGILLSLHVFHRAQPSSRGSRTSREHASSYVSSMPSGIAAGRSRSTPAKRSVGRSSSSGMQPSPGKWVDLTQVIEFREFRSWHARQSHTDEAPEGTGYPWAAPSGSPKTRVGA